MGAAGMTTLKDKVAVVTGASRGVGRGAALALAAEGATVYITGRSLHAPLGNWPGTLTQTADEITAAGGRCVPLVVDHRDDAQVAVAFERIIAEQGRIDILVNSAWGGYDSMSENGEYTWPKPFWEQPLWRWDVMVNTALRGAYVASQYAARTMVAQRSGLIVNISFWAAQKYMGNVVYGIAKAGADRMSADMAHELRDHNVAAVSFYPGLVRTEGVMENAQWFDMSNSESPEFTGRAIASLANDPNLMAKSGQVVIGAALALEYGFTDIDGKQPRPLTLEEA
jgi:NAD(P)-dependent dehydrogenase (short-subunit alcohol dehydrogenase family)